MKKPLSPFRAWPTIALEFGVWKQWTDRDQIENCDRPGVYCLGIGRSMRQFDWKYVRYIGVTTSRGGCKARWNQLDRTLRGGRGHSGGKTMKEERGLLVEGTSKFTKGETRNLFVSAVVAPQATGSQRPLDIRMHGIVRYLEFEAFARFAEWAADNGRRERKPAYNKQWPWVEGESDYEANAQKAVKAIKRNEP